jgi:WXXGXW repeat (2 copies)
MKTTNRLRSLLLVFALLAAPVASYAQSWGIGVSIGIAPPALPVYVQPPCPAVGYLWTPGYWAYDPGAQDYYWVPGTWVLAPAPGLLWTPGYWAFEEGFYGWHPGYWGPRVGFYGGVNYGFGYFGTGFEGGHWHGHDFLYNRAVANVSNVSVTNVYDRTVVNNITVVNRTSFNGGPRGIQLRPTSAELEAARLPHHALTAEQQRHDSAARALPALRASVNHGQPSVAATARPAVFAGRDVRPAQAHDAASARGPGGTLASRAETAPARSNARPNVPQQPATRGAAPERLAPAHQPVAPRAAAPYQPAPPRTAPVYQPAPPHPAPAPQYAQHRTPSYPAQAPAPNREAPRAPAYAAPRAGANQAPPRSNPPAREHEGGEGPRHEPGRE